MRSGDLRYTFCPFPPHFYYLFPSTLPHFYHLSPSKVFPIKLDPGLFSHLSLSLFYPHTPSTVLPISWTLMANAHIYMDLSNTHTHDANVSTSIYNSSSSQFAFNLISCWRGVVVTKLIVRFPNQGFSCNVTSGIKFFWQW